jgi:hypothetical protein
LGSTFCVPSILAIPRYLDVLGPAINTLHHNDNLFHFPAAYQRLEESVRRTWVLSLPAMMAVLP